MNLWNVVTLLVPIGYWDDLNTHKLFLESESKRLGIKEMEDWYKIKASDLFPNGGRNLMKSFYQVLFIFFNKQKGSHINLLMAVYPHYRWKPWKFEKVPAHYWQNMKNQRDFFDDIYKYSHDYSFLKLQRELNLKTWEDWYQVTWQDVVKHGGYSLMKNHYDFNIIKYE